MKCKKCESMDLVKLKEGKFYCNSCGETIEETVSCMGFSLREEIHNYIIERCRYREDSSCKNDIWNNKRCSSASCVIIDNMEREIINNRKE